MDFCSEDDHGGAVHRCIHGSIHLIEDHAKAAGIPVRFAATKLVEGDQRIEEALKLEDVYKRQISFRCCTISCSRSRRSTWMLAATMIWTTFRTMQPRSLRRRSLRARHSRKPDDSMTI